MPDSASQQRAVLRQQMLLQLREMSIVQRRQAAQVACDRLTDTALFQRATVIMLYLPLADELDVTPAALRAFQLGKIVCVPRVDWERHEIRPVEITGIDDEVLDTDAHGVRSPKNGRLMVPSIIDLVVAPAVAFDRQGHRLGRGTGYYARLVKRLKRRARVIGVAFDQQIIEHVPVVEDSITVPMIVTERRVVRAKIAPPSRA
jgi:5-formyltetrahydrofolate cyclo-ligase